MARATKATKPKGSGRKADRAPRRSRRAADPEQKLEP